jgi:hypothetical protein|tara:strand:- start:1510 stop:2184 length:675 start_codon:yes stop_codon:yes gene_type:complete
MTVYNSLFYAILIGFFDLLINPHVKTYILLHFLRIRYFHLVNIAFNQISLIILLVILVANREKPGLVIIGIRRFLKVVCVASSLIYNWVNGLQIQREVFLVVCFGRLFVFRLDLHIVVVDVLLLCIVIYHVGLLNLFIFNAHSYVMCLLFVHHNFVHGHASVVFDVGSAAELLEKEDGLVELLSFGDMQTSFRISVFVIHVCSTFQQKVSYLRQVTQGREHETS